MEEPDHCAQAVNNTLQKLSAEYLQENVASVLANACEHTNVNEDFGGQEWACKPILGDLAAEFNGEHNYAAWCQQATTMLAVDGGADPLGKVPEVGGGPTKEDKIAEVKAEMQTVEDMKADGQDIHEELKHLKHLLKDAESQNVRLKDDKRKGDTKKSSNARTKAKKAKGGAQPAAGKEDMEDDTQEAATRLDEAQAATIVSGSSDLKIGEARWGTKVETTKAKGTKARVARRAKKKAVKAAASRGRAPPAKDSDPASAPSVAANATGNASSTKAEEAEETEKAASSSSRGGGLPFRGVEPFGVERTAKALTSSSIDESNAMVDQIERAQKTEEKRSAYRALTHLRGLMTGTYDSVAKTHLQNIAEYNAKGTWRSKHPVKHLAEEEDDVEKWAFPPAGL